MNIEITREEATVLSVALLEAIESTNKEVKRAGSDQVWVALTHLEYRYRGMKRRIDDLLYEGSI